MTLRRLLFWSHLAAGVSVGLVIACLALTGSVIAFSPQLIAAAERNVHNAATATSCVAPSTLLHNATTATSQPLTSLTVFADPHRPAQVATGSDGAVLLADPCTGRILGPGASRLRVFLKTVQELHHQVALGGVRHETLRALKNAAALLFIPIILSGLYLWFPRRLTWQHLRPSVLFRPGLHGRAREWNLHNVAGFWLCLPLLAISVTGVIMAYPWANALLFRAAGDTPPPARREGPPRAEAANPNSGRPPREGSGNHDHHPAAADFTALDLPIARALAYSPAATSVSLRLPSGHADTLTFQLTQPGRAVVLRDGLTLAATDGAVLKWEPQAAATRGRRWRTYVRFLHTGELLGLPGQAIAFVAALGLLLLVWTGFSLALRRLTAFLRHRRSAAATVPEQVRVG